jgi:hypothetical protein
MNQQGDHPFAWEPLPEILWAWLCKVEAAPGSTTAELGGTYWLRHLVEGPVKGPGQGGRRTGFGFVAHRPAADKRPSEECTWHHTAQGCTWHLTEAGRAHILAHREDYARLYGD